MNNSITLNKTDNRRIEWIDVYKGILIILVVVGHATPLFNAWIYQFHMAAFFVVSGYCCSIEKKNDISYIVKKLLVLFTPMASLEIVGIVVNGIINRFGEYEFLYGSTFKGEWITLRDFIVYGKNGVQYFGTFWFLGALLGIELMSFILVNLLGKRIKWLYYIISGLLFLAGYWMANNSIEINLSVFPIDLIFIGQGYFSLGLLLKKKSILEGIDQKESIEKWVSFFIAILIAYWGYKNNVFVDFPSRYFNNPVSEVSVAFASIYIIIVVSQEITKYTKILKKTIMFCGINSLGIMVFHFLFFKIYMIGLFWMGKMNSTQITNSVLPEELKTIENWIPMTVFAIIGSLLIWKLCKIVPVVNFLTGQNVIVVDKIISRLKKNDFRDNEKKDNIIVKGFDKIEEFDNNYSGIWKKIIVLVFLFSIPLFRSGIIINDELQARCLAMKGFGEFYKAEFSTWVNQGRALAAPINSFTKYLSFIGAEYGTSFRIGSILIILGVVVAFGVLLYKLFYDKWFSIFAGVCSLAFMPITFEHTSPNAFVGFIAFSFLLILVSSSLFVSYLETSKKKYVIFSMLLFLISMMSYEAFVTYTLLYLVIALWKNKKKNNIVKVCIFPIATALIFLICYVICGQIFPSSYEGNQLGVKSLIEPFKVIFTLFKSGFPGYYVYYPKYQYFKMIFTSVSSIDVVRISLFVLLFIMILGIILKNQNKEDSPNVESNKKNILKSGLILVSGLSFAVIPCLPNSLSLMYQENVGVDKGFFALPVSFMAFFASIFFVSYILWKVLLRSNTNFRVIILVLIVFFVINIQEMNDVISNEQNRNFERILEIEDFLKTETARNLQEGEYYAPDLYETQNILAIQEGYWTGYCNDILGLNLNLEENLSQTIIGKIYYNDNQFIVVNENNIIVLSKEKETGKKLIQVEDEDIVFDFEDEKVRVTEENGFYVYYLLRKGYSPKQGVYPDGWLEKECEYYIAAEIGKVELSFYYPGEELTNKQITFYYNDEVVDNVLLYDNFVYYEIPVESNSSGILSIQCDFEFDEKNKEDERPLSIMLHEMNVY